MAATGSAPGVLLVEHVPRSVTCEHVGQIFTPFGRVLGVERGEAVVRVTFERRCDAELAIGIRFWLL